MIARVVTGLLAGLLSLALQLNPAIAQEDHKAEAMKHAQAAVDSGKKGDVAGVGEHAAAAKVHAEAAQKERANPHLEAAIKSLDEAIAHSKMGHADLAGDAAFGAVTHLKAAEKSF